MGQHWSNYWTDNDFNRMYGERLVYEHNYPSYFPQSTSNLQTPYCYPDAALDEFRRWIREVHLAEKLPDNLHNKEYSGALLPVQLVLTA